MEYFIGKGEQEKLNVMVLVQHKQMENKYILEH